MLRTDKYRIRPNTGQDQKLDFLLWPSRLVYNAARQQHLTIYRETGQGIGSGGQWVYFRDVRRENAGRTLTHLVRSTHPAGNTCCAVWISPLRLSFAACEQVSSQGFRVSNAAPVFTASNTPMVTAASCGKTNPVTNRSTFRMWAKCGWAIIVPFRLPLKSSPLSSSGLAKGGSLHPAPQETISIRTLVYGVNI
ncbi:MAG TPA: helix-turn-helix domain-containing protein [Anaerolineaceae bacterium]|nr:helix-turn-helix domain-containing protein [Anaerolineaceae bacterium]